MLKIIIIFWSGTGNTELLANSIYDELKKSNTYVEIKNVSDIILDESIFDYDLYFLGCPAMQMEGLEEYEFEPFYKTIIDKIKEKYVALFGSYSWGDGKWMRTWEGEINNSYARLVTNGFIIKDTPSDEDILLCGEYAKKVVETVWKKYEK